MVSVSHTFVDAGLEAQGQAWWGSHVSILRQAGLRGYER